MYLTSPREKWKLFLSPYPEFISIAQMKLFWPFHPKNKKRKDQHTIGSIGLKNLSWVLEKSKSLFAQYQDELLNFFLLLHYSPSILLSFEFFLRGANLFNSWCLWDFVKRKFNEFQDLDLGLRREGLIIVINFNLSFETVKQL